MKKPKPYQAECVNALVETHKSGNDRALIVMASGLGKTLTSAFSIREFIAMCHENSRVLFLCHNNEILGKAKTEYRSVFGEEYSYGSYTGIEKTSRRVNFLFASFQTMKLHLKDFAPDEFDYVIVDEAHHGQAITFKKVISYFKPRFLLGMTATPKRLDGLDISEIFGGTVYEKDLPQAIKEHLLATVDYRLLLDDIEDIFKYLGRDDVTIAELNRNIFVPKRDEEIIRIINEKIAEKEHHKTIIFCTSINHADVMAGLIDGAAVVHSELSQSVCHERIAAFRNGRIQTIVSVDQLNEGVDIPDADVIVFLRSTVSPTVFYQQLGRGLRKTSSKKSVLILDFVANCERIEMIENLHRAIVPKTTKGGGKDSYERFSLDISTQKFREMKMDIMHLIESARANDRLSYSKEFIIQQIQGLAKELGRAPTSIDLEESDEYHLEHNTISRYFGTFNNAVIAAGFAPNRMVNYTREELISKLKELYARLGRIPLCNDLVAFSDMPSISTYRNKFGSFANALYLAGITDEEPEMERRVRRYTTEELIELLQTLGKTLGHPPKAKDFEDAPDTPGVAVLYNRFGTFSNALSMAGYELPEKHSYTKAELIEILKDISIRKGKVPSRKDIGNEHGPSVKQFIKAFGSWPNALREAGFSPDGKYTNSYTDAELIEKLQSKARSLGRTPGIRDMNADSDMPSAPTYEQHFGTYGNAIKAAGLKPTRIRSYTEDELVLQLQTLAEKLGRTPTTKEVDADHDTAAPVTFTKYFGSWQNALQAAGLPKYKRR